MWDYWWYETLPCEHVAHYHVKKLPWTLYLVALTLETLPWKLYPVTLYPGHFTLWHITMWQITLDTLSCETLPWETLPLETLIWTLYPVALYPAHFTMWHFLVWHFILWNLPYHANNVDPSIIVFKRNCYFFRTGWGHLCWVEWLVRMCWWQLRSQVLFFEDNLLNFGF